MLKRQIKPAGHRVLVKLKKINETKEVTYGDKKIIVEIKTEKKLNAEKLSTQEARIVALGPTAFKAFDDGVPWCKEGDLVMICRYSGDDRTDIEDDEIYRIINDEDVQAIFVGE